MTIIRVNYHHEDGTWWADSPDVEGWVAGGETLAEARAQVRDGLPFFLADDDVEILEGDLEHVVVVRALVTSGATSVWPAAATAAAAPVRWQPALRSAASQVRASA